MRNIGLVLKEMRVKAKIQRKEMAEKLGISWVQVGYIESPNRGKPHYQLKYLDKYCDVIGCTPMQIYCRLLEPRGSGIAKLASEYMIESIVKMSDYLSQLEKQSAVNSV